MDLLKQKRTTDEFIRRSSYTLSSFSFVFIFAWKDFFDFQFEIIDDYLCIFARNDAGCFLYLPPIGKGMPSKVIQQCFQIMDETNQQNKSISRIENVQEDQLGYFDQEKYRAYKKTDEYLYERESIVSLKGHQLKPKRNAFNHFINNYTAEFLPFDGSMIKQCEKLYEVWAEKRASNHEDEIYRHMLDENRTVHRCVLTQHDSLNLISRVVIVDGKIVSYTFGYPLNSDMFCILFEITDLDKRGLAVYTFRQFCADQQIQSFSTINAMDDFGMPNIRETKMSFQPSQVVGSYTVSRKEAQ